MNNDNRRWELIIKQINSTIDSKELLELIALQKEACKNTRLVYKRKPATDADYEGAY